jgi:hypothetical protein
MFTLGQQPGRTAAAPPVAANAGALAAPRKSATVMPHPAASGRAAPKTAKASGGGDEWTEF